MKAGPIFFFIAPSSGSGFGAVTGTGTELGHISEFAEEAKEEDSLLEEFSTGSPGG